MEVKIPETRGAKPKYDFYKMRAGESRKLKNTTSSVALNCAKRQMKRRKIKCKFRTYKQNGSIVIVRTK